MGSLIGFMILSYVVISYYVIGVICSKMFKDCEKLDKTSVDYKKGTTCVFLYWLFSPVTLIVIVITSILDFYEK